MRKYAIIIVKTEQEKGSLSNFIESIFAYQKKISKPKSI